jgi:NADPH:quinone reductase-like Zn-dependent oxidoreductase
MRAVRLAETSGPAALRVEQIPVPTPGEGEVLVRVRAAALNRRDLFITQGKYPNIVLPQTLGADGAGEVAAFGAGAQTELKVGDDVVIDPMIGWGDDERVWDGRTSSLLGMPSAGTFAEYACVPAANVYVKPRGLTMEEAAAIPLAGLTAYRATFVRGRLQPGETVLITGVGGGVQTFALIFAKHARARVIVTSSSDEKLEQARALGADLTLNYRTTADWHKQARAAGPIDLAIDSSGGDTVAKLLDAVRPGARIVVYGGTVGEATIRMFPLFWKHVDLLGTSMGSAQDFAEMLAIFEEGQPLKPAVDRIYPLEDVVSAVERMQEASQFGKIVLRID